MANRSPEQDLIDSFVEVLNNHGDDNIKISELINNNCKSKKTADIEYISESGQLWVIEAKSHDSKDAHNTVHKIFGELLKETGRKRDKECNYAILLPEDGKDFYSRLFQLVNRDKFIGFGELIPVECVFTFGDSVVSTISWQELYDHHQPSN
jgi:hypothetical protein